MASRKPLVIISGVVQQLPVGDTLNAPITEVDVYSVVADAAFIAGQVVYPSAAGHADKARANAVGTSNVMGFAQAAISSAASGVIQTSGVLTLTTGEWDAVFGTTGGLTFNTVYYLSAGTAGLGTATAPSTVGQTVVRLGLALSTVDLLIGIEPYILL